MFDYEEACPVSKAATVLSERWTIQIIREMLFGATRFSELQTFLPKISPTLLNTRLHSLEASGLIVKKRIPEKKGYEYHLTPSGQALKPVLQEIGRWGMRWTFENMNPVQLNLSTIIRDFSVSLKQDELPGDNLTIQFNITDEDPPLKKYIMLRSGNSQFCEDNIGTEVDVYITGSLETLGNLWYGKISHTQAIEQGLLKVVGPGYLVNNLSKWLGVSQFAGIKPEQKSS